MSPPMSPPSAEIIAQAMEIVKQHFESVYTFHSSVTGLTTHERHDKDVYIASAGKSGTTLLQQMVYQLLAATGRVPTDPEGEKFDDISEVVPYVDASNLTGVLKGKHECDPLVYKSHSGSEQIGNVGKIVYIVREGKNTLPSYLDFALEWVSGEEVKGEHLRKAVYERFVMATLGLTRDEDGKLVEVGKGGYSWVDMVKDSGFYNWFENVKVWLTLERENVLYLIFEDVVGDLKSCIRNVAKFVGIDAGEDVVDKVAMKCSKESMASDSRFDDIMVGRAMGWTGNGGHRVRKDSKGFKDIQLPADLTEAFEERYQTIMGCQNYTDLAQIFREKNTKL